MSSTAPSSAYHSTIETTNVSLWTMIRDQGGSTAVAQGRIYDPTTLAAGVMLGAHILDPTRALLTFSSTYINATVASGTYQQYSAYTNDFTPKWFVVDCTNGNRSSVGGPAGNAIPLPTGHLPTTPIAPALSGSFMYGTDIYTSIQALNAANQPIQVVTRFDKSNLGIPLQYCALGGYSSSQVTVTSTVSGTTTVTFNRGIFVDPDYVYLFGQGSDGLLYLARRNRRMLSDAATRQSTRASAPGTNLKPGLGFWEFCNGASWTTYPTTTPTLPAALLNGTIGNGTLNNLMVPNYLGSPTATPLRDARGVSIACSGPVSAAQAGGCVVFSVTQQAGSNLVGVFYASRSWNRAQSQINIGTSLSWDSGQDIQLSSGSYAGGGIQLQQNLPVATTAPTLPSGAGIVAVIPYCIAYPSGSTTFSIPYYWGAVGLPAAY